MAHYTGKVVVVTGASQGIGRALCLELSPQRPRLVLAARDAVGLEAVASACRERGAEALAVPTDVTDVEACRRLIERAVEAFGGVDVLVNNAGIASYGLAEETSERQWDNIIDTNLKGTFLFMRQVLPLMKKRGRGTIVNISSAMGVEGVGYFSAYCASKFGVVGLTQAVAEEAAEGGLRLYAVLPWAVNTTLLAGSDFRMDPSEMLTPEYVARRIFEAAEGRRKSGALFKVYS
jgi:NAD(P)-dependent dehydrogenase (short-subunit alcohol dehydrogenase family)